MTEMDNLKYITFIYASTPQTGFRIYCQFKNLHHILKIYVRKMIHLTIST